ncbi:MAG: hypothetical protein IPL99_24750 [Candidatus Competibacteraceae bacterium]|nr:hypothetical protein [Candidatus Competibacteraceae bacterium]
MAQLPIKDFPGYTVDDMGKVWREDQKEPVEETVSYDGYSLVKLWRNGQPVIKRVDWMVLEAFKPFKRKKIKPMVKIPIEDFPGYTMDERGRVWRKNEKDPVEETLSHDGHSLVTLWRNGKPFTKRVDRLGLKAFV